MYDKKNPIISYRQETVLTAFFQSSGKYFMLIQNGYKPRMVASEIQLIHLKKKIYGKKIKNKYLTAPESAQTLTFTKSLLKYEAIRLLF